MRLLLIGLLVTAVSSQMTIDPSVLEAIYGTPPTAAPAVGPQPKELEDITVKPTVAPTTLTDDNGQRCQCLPYYLCNANNIGVDANNVSVTGYGELDIRFGIDKPPACTVSQEVCCIIPKDMELPTPKPKPQPDPTKVKGCGYRNPKGIGAYFKGPSTQFGEYPWVVALLDAKNGSYAGVGVLINPEVVMTGAHIAKMFAPGGLKIRAGEWDTQTEQEIFAYQERAVNDIYNHKDFNHKNLKYDIALLRLDRPVELAEHINVICLPEQDEVFDSHKNCVANGWGKNSFGLEGRYAVILKKVEVNMVPHDRCEQQFKKTKLGVHFILDNTFLCAGGEEGKDTCKGDGGAPLACPTGNDRYKLTGLVAWGVGCGQKDVPAAYTNVPKFRSWVDDKMAAWGLETTSYRIQ